MFLNHLEFFLVLDPFALDLTLGWVPGSITAELVVRKASHAVHLEGCSLGPYPILFLFPLF